MEVNSVLTVADIQAQPIKVFAYRIAKDPKPGTKVMHAAEVNDTIAYAVVDKVADMIATTWRTPAAGTISELFPLVMVKYYHNPDRIFEIHAPAIFYDRAPRKDIHITSYSKKHGSLPYQFSWIHEYTQKNAMNKDHDKNVFSCTVEPAGMDVALLNDEAIKLCFENEAKRLGFRVTRFTRAATRPFKILTNKFYCDMEPTTPGPPTKLLKCFKKIRGPSGSQMRVTFKNKTIDTYTSKAPKRKRGPKTSAAKKAAKLARAIQDLASRFE